MSLKLLLAAWIFVALGFSAAAGAQTTYYSLTSGGGQMQIGGGLPLPIQAASPAYTGTMFPPLLIPPNPNKPIQQTNGPDPKQITVPVGAFYRKPAGAVVIGVAVENTSVYQVRTNIEFSGPAPANGPAVFKAGGRPGKAITTRSGPPSTGGVIRYSRTANQFGGFSRTRVVPLSTIRAWAHGPLGYPPCKHPVFGGTQSGCVAILQEVHPMSLAVQGAMTGVVETSPGGFAATAGLTASTPEAGKGAVQAVSVPAMTGLIAKAAFLGMTAPISNMATSAGFPWTTGMVTISQNTGNGYGEVFTITGMDTRMAGIGTLSLVSGALSYRVTSGPNSNRGWARYTLPEPAAVLGAAAALATLGICHGLVRWGSR